MIDGQRLLGQALKRTAAKKGARKVAIAKKPEKRGKRIYLQAGRGKEACGCKAERDDRVRPEAREQKDRENDEVRGRYDKDG
jgi:hypothetical protein